MIDPKNLQEALKSISEQTQETYRKQQELQAKITADKISDFYTKIVGAQFDKSVAYTNLIVIGGYATFFALWSQVKDHLAPLYELLSASSILISGTSFVFFEVYKMAFTAKLLRKQSDILRDESIRNKPDEILKRFEQYENAAHQASIGFGRIWLASFWVSVTFALLAICILFGGLISGLIKTYNEHPH